MFLVCLNHFVEPMQSMSASYRTELATATTSGSPSNCVAAVSGFSAPQKRQTASNSILASLPSKGGNTREPMLWLTLP